MQIDLSQFFDIFFEEAEEHLATLESVLLALDIDAPDAEALNAIFRAAHSIKGGAGTFGFTDLINVTHQLETLLDAVRKHTLQLTPSHIDTILAATDVLRDILNNCRQGVATDPILIQEMEARLRAELLPKDTSSAAIPVLQEEARTHHFSIATDGQLAWEALLQRLTAEPRAKITGFPVEPEAKDPLCIEFIGTDSEFADLCDSLAFVVPPSAIRLEHAPPPIVDDADSWGLFHEETSTAVVSPSVLEEDDGWGLFEEDTPPAIAIVPSPLPLTLIEEDDGWGLFNTAPTSPAPSNATPQVTASETTDDDEGFGFFTPVPQPPAATSLATAMAEEGDGFGLFVPVPLAPPAPPVVPANIPQVVAPAATPRTAPTPTRNTNNAESATIRVNVEKVDQLLDLVGELVITQSMLAQCAAQLELQGGGNEILLAGVKQLERNTRDLQESVMSVRMMPIASVFNRFPRLVRDLAGKLGKQVELHLEGESTELDKAFIEKLADPMTHLVRNSLDHGIESPEKRQQSGKSPIGHLTLRASHQGGNIVIEIRDDGAGLNRERILAKAIERGLPVHEGMPDTEVWNLIFEAGFSTAAEVSDISGRGVGMDVVRRNIQEMGGSIMIESVAGVGSTITLRLPLTLAILDGMSIRVNGEVYVLPLTCIIESLQAQPNQYKTLAKQGEVLQVRGQYLPLIRLADIFLTHKTEQPMVSTAAQQGLCMIVEAEKEMVALQVDELLGQQQVVIKNLETNYRRVSGISGATIMGDGRVALILDVPAVVRMAKNRSRA